MITINISDENWEELNKQKKRGETFNDVITHLLRSTRRIKNDKKC